MTFNSVVFFKPMTHERFLLADKNRSRVMENRPILLSADNVSGNRTCSNFVGRLSADIGERSAVIGR